MSFSRTCWLLDGAWFQCRCGGFWVISHLLMFPGSGILQWSKVLELSLLPLGFGQCLTEASRLLCAHIIENKTPMLMVKQLSQPGTPKGIHRIMQRRGRKEIEVTSGRKCKVKQEESNQASNQVPK